MTRGRRDPEALVVEVSDDGDGGADPVVDGHGLIGSRLLTKLGVRSRVQAVILAYETGLVTAGGGEHGA